MARFKNILYGAGKRRGYMLIGLCAVLCVFAGAIVACRPDSTAELPKETLGQGEDSENGEGEEDGPIYYTVSPIVMEKIDSLPQKAASAFMTAAPVNGSPLYYFFEEGLTFYRYTYHDTAYYKCTLCLPEGYEDGKILYARSGGGSGEMLITVETEEGLLEYLLHFDSAEPSFVVKLTEDEEAQMAETMSTQYVKIYRCDDVYRDDNTETYGLASVYIPTAFTDYIVSDVEVLFCDDGCDPTVAVNRALFGYAPAWRVEKYTEYTSEDGWNYTARVYENIVPEDIAAAMKAQGAPQSVYAPREYLYLLTLDENHYVYAKLTPKFAETEKPDGEIDIVNRIMRNALVHIWTEDTDNSAFIDIEDDAATDV